MDLSCLLTIIMSCLLPTSWSGIDETLTITFSESTHFGHACKINCTRPVTSARVANCILPSCSAPLYNVVCNVSVCIQKMTVL